MARTYEAYTQTAIAGFEAGFTSKAAQKRSLTNVSYAYDVVHREVANAILKQINQVRGTAEEQKFNDLYWAVPMDLHQVREKHFALLVDYPEFEKVRDLINLRNEIKVAEIIKAVRDVNEEKVKAVYQTIENLIKTRKESYLRGYDLSEMFGRMSVHVNSHYVYTRHGSYIRNFFYLFGKLTALNVIIAIHQQREKEGK